MNPETGEIKEFQSMEEARKQGFTVPLKCPPRPNCRKCFGRGWEGTNDAGFKVPCTCTQRSR